MTVVTRSARPESGLPTIDLDLSAFGGGSKPFALPNLADPAKCPGELYIIAFSDGFESKEAQASAMVSSIMTFFPELGRLMKRLTIFDWLDIITAWKDASQQALSVDPKGSSSSTSG